MECIVFFNTFWRGSGSNRPLIRKAVETGKKVVVATNDLYDSYFLPTVGTLICTFGTVPQGLRIAADIIFGTADPAGTWPLSRISPNETIPPDKEVDHFTAGHFSPR